MFQSFNVSDFTMVIMLYLVGLVISQLLIKQLIDKSIKIATTSAKRALAIGIIATVVGFGLWFAAIWFYGWSAVAAFVLASIVETVVSIVRRKTIRNAIFDSLGHHYEPLNFNEINGKSL